MVLSKEHISLGDRYLLEVSVLGGQFVLEFYAVEMPKRFPVPLILGIPFFAVAGEVRIDIGKCTVERQLPFRPKWSEFLLPPSVIQAALEKRPLIFIGHLQLCCERRNQYGECTYLPTGLPNCNNPDLQAHPETGHARRWLQKVMPIMPESLQKKIRQARFSDLVQAYWDVFEVAPLRSLCKCMIAQLFEVQLEKIITRPKAWNI